MFNKATEENYPAVVSAFQSTFLIFFCVQSANIKYLKSAHVQLHKLLLCKICETRYNLQVEETIEQIAICTLKLLLVNILEEVFHCKGKKYTY